ncbi:MAG TPA: SMI1/KNR4 family protein [Kofleriaceae bacterium]|nr:SMI1/KNR4 family protein [Kofleriaceae bacterium]
MARAKKAAKARPTAKAAKGKAAPAKVKAKAKAAPKKAKATAKAGPKAKQPAKTSAKAKAAPRTKQPAKASAKTPAKAAPRKRGFVDTSPDRFDIATDAIPESIAVESSSDPSARSLTARERAMRSLPVVEILDDPHPIGALRRFLDSVKGEATQQQAQIALGSAQLILLPIAREHRGGNEVKELVDLVLDHWLYFGERRKGFHAQEFLRNALTAIGVDRERIAKLEDLIPANATPELLFNLACAHAIARDKVALLRAVERALAAGVSPSQFRRDADFAVYAKDPDLSALLSRAEIPPIPVDIEPYLPAVRGALDSLVATLREYGESIELRPPVRLDAILDAERARRISLPNDYRALLTITNGMALWDHTFFGAGDYRELTPLALRAQHYLDAMAEAGRSGIEDCVPLANWGRPTDWLLYDLRGHLRGHEPGYLLMLGGDEHQVNDLAAALYQLEDIARETFGTN